MKALVTGASSGMGRDMAKYLYSLGYELYLVARNKKDLNREFKGYKNIHTYGYNLIIEEECVKLYKELKDENIDILINNAGFGIISNLFINIPPIATLLAYSLLREEILNLTSATLLKLVLTGPGQNIDILTLDLSLFNSSYIAKDKLTI